MAAPIDHIREAERRKRLGQYFSGVGLARLLGKLAQADKAQSIIDPMAGIGDMLAGCLALGARPKQLSAVEIDPLVETTCARRLPEAGCVLGNAFSTSTLLKLPNREWDLVITNPPYVRYQSMTLAGDAGGNCPSAIEVRSNLIESLEQMTALDEIDKRLFRAIARGYSGLADLAVPSWILCAAMVTLGGRLALVVPESWLSRDYAVIVQYLILRWFRIEHIVEDEHAAWFNGAQIKTTLLVARRVRRRDGAFDWREDETFVRTRISAKAAGPEGPISRLFPKSQKPEVLFANRLAGVSNSKTGIKDDFVSSTAASLGLVAENLKKTCSKQKWFAAMGERNTERSSVSNPTECLAAWLGPGQRRAIVSLESLGVSIGQGLRTGANDFFYVTYIEDDGVRAIVSVSGYGITEIIHVPLEYLRSVIRRQSELPQGYVIRQSALKYRVLDLRKTALSEDIRRGGTLARRTYVPMPKELSSLVRRISMADIGTNGNAKSIVSLSAVAPNVRNGDLDKGCPPRFWYMLPDFAPRHQPDVIVPRVNGGSPKAWLINDRRVLADANFSTLRVHNSKLDVHALLALINSSWCRSFLELGASVMGGGALKVEATHLRRMPVPSLNESERSQLSLLGRRLATTAEDTHDIDVLVASALLGKSASKQQVGALSQLAEEGLMRRKNHKTKMESR